MTKFKLFLRQNSLAIIGSVGLILVLVGLLFAIWPHSHPNIATVFISVGSSLIAASMTAFLSPVTEEVYQRFLKMGVTEVYASRRDIDHNRWCKEWLAGASERVKLIGIAHHEWARDNDFEPAILDRVRHKVEIHVYFLDPNSDVALKRSEEDTGRDLINTIKKSIEVMWNIRNKLEAEAKEKFKLFVYSATPAGITWVDNLIVASHYLAAFQNLTSPALILRPVSSQDMYSVYAKNARAIAEHATELKTEIIDQYIPPKKLEPAPVPGAEGGDGPAR